MNGGRNIPADMPGPSSRMQSAALSVRFRKRVQRRNRDSETLGNKLVEDNNSKVSRPSIDSLPPMRAIKERRFSLDVLETIETVGQGPVLVHAIPDNFITLEHATRESIRDLDLIPAGYSSQTVWQDINSALDQLYRVWTKIKEAADDLRLYVPMCLTSHKCSQELSIESAAEECAYMGEQGICGTILTRIIEEAYNKFKPSFDNVLDLIASAFGEEDRTLQSTSVIGISIAARAVRFLGMVREVENQLQRVRGDTFQFLATESFHMERRRNLERLLEQMCAYIEALQSGFLQPRHLYAKGRASIKRLRSLAEVMRRCWKENGLLVRHLHKVYPEFTPLAYKKHAHLLCRAASLATIMQTSSEVQAYLSNSVPMCYNDEIVEDVLEAQLWLLPCLIDLFGLSRFCAKKLNSTSMSDTHVPTDAPCVKDVKHVIYDLIVATIARASWLMTWIDQSTSPNLFNLRDQGSQTLFFIYKYNKSNLSLKCTPESPTEDLTRYSSLLFSTNTLINGLLSVHGMIQSGALFTQGLEEAVESSTRSEEADGVLFHEVEALEQLISSQLSIHSFPVFPEDSWDTESRSEANSSPVLGMTIPNQVSKSEESFSSFSCDLSSGFVDMLNEKANELPAPFEEELVPVIQEAKEQAGGPSRTSPFIAQMPKAKLPQLRRQRSWRSRSSWLSCLCFNSQEAEHQRDEDQRSSATNVGLLWNGDLNTTSTGVHSVRADELEAHELIGSGSAGKIWKMTYSTKPVAVKIMNEGLSDGTRQQFLKATELHNRLSGHPNIVQLTGICPELLEPEGDSLPNLAMIMELCDLGDLFKILCEARWVRDKKNFNQDITEYMSSRGYMIYSDWSLRLQVACDITAGMAHMHSEGIVHRDLTSYNVVVKRGDAGEWITKVCDFERSREIPESGLIPRSDTFANSPAWAAPEIIDNRDYSTQADVYSMGVILWELMTLQNPHELYMECVRSGKPFCYEYKQTQLLSQLHNSCDSELPELTQELTSLVHGCLLEDFHSRPTMYSLHQSLTKLHNTVYHSFQ